MNSDFDQFEYSGGRNPGRGGEAINAFKKPVQTLRIDDIRATIWRRQTRAGPIFTATLGRLYQVRDIYKTSNSYAYDELATLIRAATHVRDILADLATQEGLDAITGVGGTRTGHGDEGEPSPAAATADGADDLDVPIVTAIDANARPTDGRARRNADPNG